MYICNNQKLIIYTKKSIKVRTSIADKVLFSKRKIKIKNTKKNSLESLVIILIYVFYLQSSLSKYIILGLLNNIEIYHHNKDYILYDQNT